MESQHSEDFSGRNLNWLISESPLVDGNHVIVTPEVRKPASLPLTRYPEKRFG